MDKTCPGVSHTLNEAGILLVFCLLVSENNPSVSQVKGWSCGGGPVQP